MPGKKKKDTPSPDPNEGYDVRSGLSVEAVRGMVYECINEMVASPQVGAEALDTSGAGQADPGQVTGDDQGGAEIEESPFSEDKTPKELHSQILLEQKALRAFKKDIINAHKNGIILADTAASLEAYLDAQDKEFLLGSYNTPKVRALNADYKLIGITIDACAMREDRETVFFNEAMDLIRFHYDHQETRGMLDAQGRNERYYQGVVSSETTHNVKEMMPKAGGGGWLRWLTGGGKAQSSREVE